MSGSSARAIRSARTKQMMPATFAEFARWAKENEDARSSRVHQNVLVVALANKLARISWAVLRGSQKFAAGNARDHGRGKPCSVMHFLIKFRR
jgi:hypothetical protein